MGFCHLCVFVRFDLYDIDMDLCFAVIAGTNVAPKMHHRASKDTRKCVEDGRCFFLCCVQKKIFFWWWKIDPFCFWCAKVYLRARERIVIFLTYATHFCTYSVSCIYLLTTAAAEATFSVLWFVHLVLVPQINQALAALHFHTNLKAKLNRSEEEESVIIARKKKRAFCVFCARYVFVVSQMTLEMMRNDVLCTHERNWRTCISFNIFVLRYCSILYFFLEKILICFCLIQSQFLCSVPMITIFFFVISVTIFGNIFRFVNFVANRCCRWFFLLFLLEKSFIEWCLLWLGFVLLFCCWK